MQIVEYRITLPLTLQEYQRAQFFTINESLKTDQNGSGKVVTLRNESFSNYPLLNGEKFHKGQYTAKVYHWSTKIPKFLKAILPEQAMDVHEEAWDAYPYCRTLLTNSVYSRERFYIKIESLHLENDCGAQQNVHELPEELLRKRKVVFIDIANDIVALKDYKDNEDPSKFKSLRTGRGPLIGSLWRETCQPVMTCYKLVTCEFKSFGLQNLFELLMQKFEKRILTNFHRQLFCSIDQWYDLTLDDVRNNGEEYENRNCNRSVKIDTSEVVEKKLLYSKILN